MDVQLVVRDRRGQSDIVALTTQALCRDNGCLSPLVVIASLEIYEYQYAIWFTRFEKGKLFITLIFVHAFLSSSRNFTINKKMETLDSILIPALFMPRKQRIN